MNGCPKCAEWSEWAGAAPLKTVPIPRCTLCGLPVHAPYYAIGQPVCDGCAKELAAQREARVARMGAKG